MIGFEMELMFLAHSEAMRAWRRTKRINLKQIEKKMTISLVGYSVLRKKNGVIYFDVEKTDPDSEKDGVNAATVYGILNYYKDELKNGCYICDGEKPINHQTHFQDYLEKYFGFRKAYCKLNVKYKKGVGAVVKILYPFRKVLTNLMRILWFIKLTEYLRWKRLLEKNE